MATKLEIFECSVYIYSVEINCFKPKRIYSRFQMDNMQIIDIISFDVHEGKNKVSLYAGIQFITRISCLEAFQTCPLYIYFCNAQAQTICACGFDMSPLIVDAFKSSNSESNNSIAHQEKLILQNRYDQQIGVGRFEFSCRHFSQDLSIIQNFVEEDKVAQETNVITEQPQLEENTRANAMVMARSSRKRYQMPIMKDLLVLTKKYQKSSNGLVDEVESLENEVRMIEKRQNMILQKKNQQQRRKIDIHQPLIPDTSSTHTSDFSYFENSSEYSYNSIMNQTFKDVEKTCGKSFSHHKTHHNRHKEHHHHHHHKKETKEPEVETKQENQVQNTKDHISGTSSKISKSGFDAFMERQNAASARRQSFIILSGNESQSFSQNSQISSKKLQKQKPSTPQQQQKQQQQQQQQQQARSTEEAQTQVVGSQKQTNQEQPTSQTANPTKPDKLDEKTKKDTKKEQQKTEKQSEKQKPQPKEENNLSEDKRPNEDASSSKISSDHSFASSKSSKSSKSSISQIEPVSTVETLDIPSDSSKSSVKSKSSAKSATSKESETLRISASSRASNSSRSSKTSRTSRSSKASETSKISSSSKKSTTSVDDDIVEEPTTSNVIDVEQSSRIDNESTQKLSFTGTQETLEIDDDDVVDVEQKSSTANKTSTSTSTKNQTKPSKTSSGVEFSNDLSKNDTENISPSNSEMDEKDQHSSITESFISKKNDSGDESKMKNNLDDINLSELLDGLNDPSIETGSITSELRNDLGIDSESTMDFKLKKSEKKEDTPPPPPPDPEPEEKEEIEEKKSTNHKDQISELQSGIDIDDIFSD